ncbi:hypothetical protein [Staphylococcus warneri]|uniref:hypothetical protein n=1 Tax=Staphylococcus warneri TaxID=1292 RepID=UPI0009BA66DB|nr:hypothetical protein [Staphylococcus warneri]
MILRLTYHFLSAVALSFILLLSTMTIDVLLQHPHLTQLLLNIDFLVNPNLIPTWMEVIIHLSIGVMIYLIFMVLYNISKLLYHLAYLTLLVIFIGMYPFLIAIAQRSFFVFNATEWIWWLLAHIVFMVFMYICITFISKLHL